MNSIKRKILITLNNSMLSGIETFAFLLAKYLNNSKYELIMAIPGKGPLCELFDKNNIKYIIFNDKKHKPYSLKGIWFLFKYILKNKFDIIHAQAGIAPCIIGKLLRVKLIIEHKHGLDFTMEKILKMKFCQLNYEKVKKYFVDYTFTGCNNDKNILINKFRYDAQKIIVIYNGIVPHSEIPEVSENNPLIIGNIGRLTYQKAQEVFINMAKELSLKGVQCLYYLYGSGENYDLYNRLIENYNLSDTVFLMGYTENVYEAMSKIDIFILTSRYEGIPYVILQAMDYAKPIISTDVGGINEIIKDGFNGLLVKNGDISELTEKVIYIIENKKLRAEISKNARSSLLENYTIEKTIETIKMIYNK